MKNDSSRSVDPAEESPVSQDHPHAGGAAIPLPSAEGEAAFFAVAASPEPAPFSGTPGEEEVSPSPAAETSPADGTSPAAAEGTGHGPLPSAGPVAEPAPLTPEAAPASEAAPAALSFWKSRPILKAESPLPSSFSSRLFGLLGYMPLVPLVLMLVLQTIFSLDARELWYSDEIRHADVFRNFLQHPGVMLTLDGEIYPDKPPLYFAFLWGVHAVLQQISLLTASIPTTFFVGTAVSAFFFLLASMLLGRIVARMDGRSLLAGGIVLLSSGLMLGLVHYARMDLLFAAAIVLCQVAFFHALVRRRSFTLMGCAFFLAGVACLLKGPLGLALPLLAAFVFSCWRGTPARLFRLDALAGLLVFLAIIGTWVGGVYLETGGFDYLINSVLKHQIVARALDASHHKEPWHYYLVRLPLVFLPWTLAVLSVRWHRLFSGDTRAALARSRQPEGEGLAFLWITVLVTLVALSLVSTKIHVYFLPALPALSLLTGRALLRLAAPQAGMLRHSLAVFFLLGGVGIVLFSLMLFGFMPVPDALNLPRWQLPLNGSFFFVAMLLVALAATLWFGLRGNRPEGVLLLVAFFTTGLAFPLANMVAPSFNAVLSPKAQALVLREFVEAGYKPFSFKIYSGTHAYYAGHSVPAFASLREAQDLVNAHTPFVLAIRAKDFDTWAEKPEALHEVHRQWIETNEHLLLAYPVSPTNGPVKKEAPGAVNEGEGFPGVAPAPDVPEKLPESVPPAVNGTITPPVNGTEALPETGTVPTGNGTEALPETGTVPTGNGTEALPETGTVPTETGIVPTGNGTGMPEQAPGTPQEGFVREAAPQTPDTGDATNGTVPATPTPVAGTAAEMPHNATR